MPHFDQARNAEQSQFVRRPPADAETGPHERDAERQLAGSRIAAQLIEAQLRILAGLVEAPGIDQSLKEPIGPLIANVGRGAGMLQPLKHRAARVDVSERRFGQPQPDYRASTPHDAERKELGIDVAVLAIDLQHAAKPAAARSKSVRSGAALASPE